MRDAVEMASFALFGGLMGGVGIVLVVLKFGRILA